MNDKIYNEVGCHKTSGSHVNYILAEMTFSMRTLNSNASTRAPVAKSAKLENKIVDLPGILVLDTTWKPEFDEFEDLNKTWMPGAFPSDSDESDEFPDTKSAEIPTECSNFSDAKASCKHCPDDPCLCDPCVRQTKNHQISFQKDIKDDEDSLEIFPAARPVEEKLSTIHELGFENILNSVHPGRKSMDVSLGSKTGFDGLPDIPNLPRELRLIRQNSSSLVNRLTKSNSLEGSTGLDGHPCAESRFGGLGCPDIRMPEAFSRFNRESSSNGRSYKLRKVRASSVDTTSELRSSHVVILLAETIIEKNLLRILNVDSDEVKIKTAVVIEMLVKKDVVNPSIFCDIRNIFFFATELRNISKTIQKQSFTQV